MNKPTYYPVLDDWLGAWDALRIEADDVEEADMLAHAPWYKALVERMTEQAARTGFGKRCGALGDASGAKDGEIPTGGAEGALQGALGL